MELFTFQAAYKNISKRLKLQYYFFIKTLHLPEKEWLSMRKKYIYAPLLFASLFLVSPNFLLAEEQILQSSENTSPKKERAIDKVNKIHHRNHNTPPPFVQNAMKSNAGG